MNLILLDGAELSDHGVARLSDVRAVHMLGVLKVAPGQTVRVGLIDGPRGIGTVQTVAGNVVEMSCAFEPTTPNRPRIDLLLAVPRPKVLRRLWSQIAAIGVGRVILTNAEKVESPYFATHFLDSSTYRALLIEGLQQARDTMVPIVSIHRRFKPLVEDDLDTLSGPALRLVADPAAPMSTGDAIRERLDTDPTTRVLLAVGPEGGWNDFELSLLGAHGFQGISMGPRTLRTDTACVALLALAHDALG